jgi:hypothetical protein
MEMRLPKKLNMVSWEQQLRAGRMASSWESVISHSSRSRLSRVPASVSSRAPRSSSLKSFKEQSCRCRYLSWLVLGHWDRCLKSESFSGVDLKERISKGVWLLRREQS